MRDPISLRPHPLESWGKLRRKGVVPAASRPSLRRQTLQPLVIHLAMGHLSDIMKVPFHLQGRFRYNCGFICQLESTAP